MIPQTDIVLPFRATREFPAEKYFIECVDTLCQHTMNFRFIFVDDQCDADARAILEQTAARFPDSLLIRTHRQHWFTKAVNLGLRMVRTPWVVCLNSDTVLDHGWLEEMYSVRDEAEAQIGKRVGLVGSVLSGEEPRRWAASYNPDYVTGHAWLLSMQALTDVSVARGTPGIYLDETRPDAIHIRSDVFLSWDLNRLGWECVKSFKSAVGHVAGKSWGHQLHRIPQSLADVAYKYYGG